MRRAGALLIALWLAFTACGCGEFIDSMRSRAARPEPPPLATKLTVRLPTFYVEELPSGLTLVVHEQRFLPLCSVRLELRLGSAAVPTSQAGLPALTYGALKAAALEPDDGAGLAALGVDLETMVEHHGAAFTMVTQSATLPEALRRLGRGLAAPPTAGNVEAARAEAREQARLVASTPGGAGLLSLQRLLYGADHPLAMGAYGTEPTLARHTLADVTAFARRALRPQRTALIIGGRVTIAEARALALAAFGGAAAPEPAPPDSTPPEPPPPDAPPSAPGFYLLPWKGLPQPLLLGGRLLPRMTHEQVNATSQALHLLTRFVNVRVTLNQGASYGANDLLHIGRTGMLFLLRVSVQPDATKDVVQAVEDFLRKGRLMDSGTRNRSEQSLRAMRNSLWSSREHGFTFTPIKGASARELQISQALGLVTTYEGLEATGAALGRLFRIGLAWNTDTNALRETEFLIGAPPLIYDPDAYRFVLIGDPEQIRRQIRDGKLRPL